MQENEQSSSKEPLTVEQLLQLKRLEKPGREFWAGFERDLQQKQLQALVRPSRWAKVRLALSTPRHSLASVSAVAALGIAAVVAVFSFYATTVDGNLEMASIQSLEQGEAVMQVAEASEPATAEEVEETEETSAPRRTDAFFVVDALRPEGGKSAPEAFRTVAVPETLVGVADTSAYYVVNAFTTGPGHLAGDVTLEF